MMTKESSNQRCAELKIAGMTCSSCEIMLERKLNKIAGVVDVNIDHRTGNAKITADASALPHPEEIEKVIRDAGYRLEDGSSQGVTGLDIERGIWKVAIDGMTCASCEKLLRGKLKLVPGVNNASVHWQKGIANIYFKDQVPLWDNLQEVVQSAGYQLRHLDETPSVVEPPHKKWMEIGGALIAIFALYKILQVFNIVTVTASGSGAATYGGILLIGLVAGTSSCLAVTGGLLLSLAAKYNEVHRAETKWEKFKPLFAFNIGRIASYVLLGGIVGIIGKSITLTPRMTGYMNVVVALVMLYLALSILKLLPKGSLGIRPPKALSHWIASLTESEHPAAPFALGAGTFFLPCGFTQSLQLAALASGSFLTGALTMGIFAIGTLPSLLGISAISSTAKGKFSHLFLRFSGTLVFVLALYNLNNGFLLTGVDAAAYLPSFSSSTVAYQAGSDPNVTESNGTQVIHMRVTPYGYEPNSFTIAAGKPTIVEAAADQNISGCTSVLTAPALGLSKFLQKGIVNTLGPFTPTQDFTLTCSMGMVRARVYVAGGSPLAAAVSGGSAVNAQVPANAQVVNLTWTAYGYSPSVIEVRAGSPTAVNISATSPAGGCMSTVVFPNFDQSTFVPAPGASPATVLLATDRAQPGDYPITCGMGSRMAILRVRPA